MPAASSPSPTDHLSVNLGSGDVNEGTALLTASNGHSNNNNNDNNTDDMDMESLSVGSSSIHSGRSYHSLQSNLPLHISTGLLPEMEIRCHKLDKKRGLVACHQDEALQGAKAGKAHYWIDIDAHQHYHANKLKQWLYDLKLPNFVIEVLAEPPENWASQIIPLHKACLAVIRIVPNQVDSDEMAHLAALTLRNMLITFTSCLHTTNDNPHQSGLYYYPALERLKQKERIPLPTSSGALLAWLRWQVDRASDATRQLRLQVIQMDEAMDRDIRSVQWQEIIDAKDQLLRVLSVAEEQTACLESLAGAETDGLDFSNLKGSLSILLATTRSTERMALRLEKQLGDLRQRHENYDHTVMNRRLAVLTVLSAVFLPLTLLTGVWGMNFEDMPELQKPYAYPLALCFMLSLATLMICYFRKSGWFN